MGTLRWISVLPLAFAAAFVVAIPLHLVVISTLGLEGMDPIGVFVQGIVTPVAFVYAGARTAPSRQIVVGLALACIAVAGVAMQDVGAGIINMVGAAAGVLLIRQYVHRDRADPDPSVGV